MASIQKRKNKNGTSHWRAVVRSQRNLVKIYLNKSSKEFQHEKTTQPSKETDTKPDKVPSGKILNELREMIQKAREFVASTVNSSLTLLYWHIGDRIRNEILLGERAEYGKSIIPSLSHQLILEYGNGFNKTNLHRMVKFSETFQINKLWRH